MKLNVNANIQIKGVGSDLCMVAIMVVAVYRFLFRRFACGSWWSVCMWFVRGFAGFR